MAFITGTELKEFEILNEQKGEEISLSFLMNEIKK